MRAALLVAFIPIMSTSALGEEFQGKYIGRLSLDPQNNQESYLTFVLTEYDVDDPDVAVCFDADNWGLAPGALYRIVVPSNDITKLQEFDQSYNMLIGFQNCQIK